MSSPHQPDTFPTASHDHSACITTALSEAESRCSELGLRLTQVRRRVLELVWISHRPVGAYTLLEQLGKEGRSAAPPTIYRALDFLLQHGLIHRIASLNAYVGCNHPGQNHGAQFFICSQCGEAAELDAHAIGSAIADNANDMGFRIDNQMVEISGTCAQCYLQEIDDETA
ncbi:MAG: transcriptional repressor [Gammaproteobacteria bacterium]|nr:transcriptional repressor [Gammaproteobacteria bacterium]